ncbi:uncharacterized protein LOC130445723 [Diorhabda sublineata]|uniref:uncharacterized protein LOC130445723 n=1 Tax=Diorhabda sublineata TaxID=1163346 RepID=UPI0024E075F1|nr:uncharacterized protein LOC130445723 [Diorhabda sublineata]XP_056637532.1 uncharacterized protein LOC130445723 [Diorhabda sublineata]
MENRMDSVKTSLISTSVDKLFYTKYKRSNRLQNSETTECDLKDSSMKTSITASENNKTSEQSTSEIVNEINLLDETSLKHTKGKYLKNYTNLEYSENDCEGIEDVSKVFKLLTKPTFHSNVKNTYRSSLKTYTNPRKCLEKNEVIESFGLPDTPIIPEKPLAGDCLDAEVLDAKEITIQELEFVEAPWCIIEFEENFINPQEIRIKPDPNTTIDDKLSNIQSTIVDEHAKRNKKILSPPNKSELIIENDRLTQEGLEVEICKVNMPRKGKLKDINYNEKSTIRPNVNYPIEDSEKDNSESRTLRSSNVIEEASMLENNTLSEKIDDSCSTRKLRSSTIHSTIKYDSDEDIESGKTKINFKSMEREQVLSSSDSETSEYSENKNKSNKIYNRFKHSLNSTTTDVFTPDSSESGRRNKFKNGKERYNLRSKEQEPLSSNKNTSTRTLRSKSCSEILFNDKIEPVKEKQLKVILHPLETTKDHHLVDNRKELNNSCGLLLEIVDIIPVSDESRPSSKLLQSKPFFNLFKNTLPKTLLVGGETRKTSRKFDWKSKYMNKSNNKDKNESLQQSEVKITNKLKSECKIDSIKKIGEVEGRKCKIFANEKLSEYLKPRSYKKKAFCVDTSLKSSNKTVETEVDGISIKKTAKNESPTDKLRNRTRKIIEIISEDITNPQESRFKRKSAENASSCEFLLPNHKNKENNEIIEATSLKYQNDDLLEGNDSNSCKSDYTSLNNDQTTLIIEENEEIVETFYCNSTKTSEYCKGDEKCVNSASRKISEEGSTVLEILSISENITNTLETPKACSTPNVVVKKGKGRNMKSPIVKLNEDVINFDVHLSTNNTDVSKVDNTCKLNNNIGNNEETILIKDLSKEKIRKNNEENLLKNIQKSSNIFLNNEFTKLPNENIFLDSKFVNTDSITLATCLNNVKITDTIEKNESEDAETNNKTILMKNVKSQAISTKQSINVSISTPQCPESNKSEENCVDSPKTHKKDSEDRSLVVEMLCTSGNIKIESPIDCGSPTVVKRGRGRSRKSSIVKLFEDVGNNDEDLRENVQKSSNIFLNNESAKLPNENVVLYSKTVNRDLTKLATCLNNDRKVSEDRNLVLQTLSTSGNIKIESTIDCGSPNIVKRGRGRPRKSPINCTSPNVVKRGRGRPRKLSIVTVDDVGNNDKNLIKNVKKSTNIFLINETAKLANKNEENYVDSHKSLINISEGGNLVLETLSTSGNIKIESPIDCGSPNVVKRGRGRPRKSSIVTIDEDDRNNEENLSANIQKSSIIFLKNESAKLPNKNEENHVDSHKSSIKDSADGNLVLETLSASGNIKIESPIDCGNPNVVKKGRGRPKKISIIKLDEDVGYNEENITESVQKSSNIFLNNESAKLTDKSGEKCVNSPQTSIKVSEDENLVIETFSTSGNIKIESPIDCGSPNVVKRGRGRPRKISIIKLDEDVGYNEENVTESVQKSSNIFLDNEYEKSPNKSGEKCLDIRKTSIKDSEDRNLVIETLSTSANIKMKSPIDCSSPNIVKRGRGRPRKSSIVTIDEDVGNNEENLTENFEKFSNMFLDNNSAKLSNKNGEKYVDSLKTSIKDSEDRNSVIGTLSTSENIKIESPIDCGSPNVVNRGRGRPRKLSIVELDDDVGNNEENLSENFLKSSNIFLNNESSELTNKSEEKCVDRTKSSIKVSEDGNLVLITLSTSGNIKMKSPIDCSSPNVIKRGRGRPRKSSIVTIDEDVANNEENITENLEKSSNIILNNESEKLTDKSEEKCVNCTQTSLQVSEDGNLVIETLSTSENTKIGSSIDCSSPNVVKKGRGRPRKSSIVTIDEDDRNNEENLTENVQQPSNIIMNNESEKLTDKSGEKCVNSPQTSIKVSDDENLVIETLSTNGNSKIESPIDCGNPNVVKKGRGRPRKLPIVELEEVVKNEGNLTENVEKPSNIILNNESEKLTDESEEKCVDCTRTSIQLSEDGNLVTETLSTSGNIKIESPIDYGNPNVVKKGRGRPRKLPTVELEEVVVNNEGNFTENVQQPSNIIMNNESEKLTDKRGDKCVDSPQTYVKVSEYENLVIETLSTSGNIKIESPIDCGNPNVVKKGRGRPRKLPTVELEEVVVNNEGNLTENVQQPSNIIMNNESEKLTDKRGEKCVDSPQTCMKVSEDENLVIETLSTSGNIKIEWPIDYGSPNVVKRGRGRPRKLPIMELEEVVVNNEGNLTENVQQPSNIIMNNESEKLTDKSGDKCFDSPQTSVKVSEDENLVIETLSTSGNIKIESPIDCGNPNVVKKGRGRPRKLPTVELEEVVVNNEGNLTENVQQPSNIIMNNESEKLTDKSGEKCVDSPQTRIKLSEDENLVIETLSTSGNIKIESPIDCGNPNVVKKGRGRPRKLPTVELEEVVVNNEGNLTENVQQPSNIIMNNESEKLTDKSGEKCVDSPQTCIKLSEDENLVIETLSTSGNIKIESPIDCGSPNVVKRGRGRPRKTPILKLDDDYSKFDKNIHIFNENFFHGDSELHKKNVTSALSTMDIPRKEKSSEESKDTLESGEITDLQNEEIDKNNIEKITAQINDSDKDIDENDLNIHILCVKNNILIEKKDIINNSDITKELESTSSDNNSLVPLKNESTQKDIIESYRKHEEDITRSTGVDKTEYTENKNNIIEDTGIIEKFIPETTKDNDKITNDNTTNKYIEVDKDCMTTDSKNNTKNDETDLDNSALKKDEDSIVIKNKKVDEMELDKNTAADIDEPTIIEDDFDDEKKFTITDGSQTNKKDEILNIVASSDSTETVFDNERSNSDKTFLKITNTEIDIYIDLLSSPKSENNEENLYNEEDTSKTDNLCTETIEKKVETKSNISLGPTSGTITYSESDKTSLDQKIGIISDIKGISNDPNFKCPLEAPMIVKNEYEDKIISNKSIDLTKLLLNDKISETKDVLTDLHEIQYQIDSEEHSGKENISTRTRSKTNLGERIDGDVDDFIPQGIVRSNSSLGINRDECSDLFLKETKNLNKEIVTNCFIENTRAVVDENGIEILDTVEEEVSGSKIMKTLDENIGRKESIECIEEFNIGDIVWAQIGKFPYWPSLISEDPVTCSFKNIMKNRCAYHVKFFGDKGKRAWINSKKLIEYKNRDDLKTYYENLKNCKSAVELQGYIIKGYIVERWTKAVDEVEFVKSQNFTFEQMINYMDEESNQEVDEKKNSTMKKGKKRKQSLGLEELEDLDGLENKKIKLEVEESVPKQRQKKSIPELKYEHSSPGKLNEETEDFIVITDEQSEEKYKINSETFNNFGSYTLEEQRSLFKRNNLFKGIPKEKVCQYCFEFGEVLKCKGGCNGIYHPHCATEVSKHQTRKKPGRSPKIDTTEKVETIKIEKIESPSSPGNQLDADNNHVEIVTIPSRIYNTPPRKTFPPDFANMTLSERIDFKMKEIMKKFESTSYAEDFNESSSDENNKSSIRDSFPQENIDSDNNLRDDTKIKPIEHVTADSDNKSNIECIKRETDSPIKHITADSEYTDEVKLKKNRSKSKITKHITADSQDTLIDPKNFKCGFCAQDLDPYCFICNETSSKRGSYIRQKCSLYQCNRFYHPECLKLWPQTQWSVIQTTKNRYSQEEVDSFVCPQHVCHTCASDDPRAALSRCSWDKIVKCLCCPASYHSSNLCVPAGTEIITSTQIICPRHRNKYAKPYTINTTWCLLCNQGGKLICCETCPTSVHPECMTVNLTDDDKFICEDCESGRLPLYDEVVWVKLGYFKWWPALIIFPNEVPPNVLNAKHGLGEFVVKFFGTYNYYWINRGRAFLFQEGDNADTGPGNKKKVEAAFRRAVEEAVVAHKMKKQFKLTQSAESVNSMKPPPYIKIKVSKPVGNVRFMDLDLSNTTACDCNPSQPNPCGPDTNCLNRLLLTECNPEVCPAGKLCNNQSFEKREYPLLVPYKTETRGWGLKTLEPLKKGQFVIEYVGELIDDEEYQRRILKMHAQKEENFYFLTIHKDRMIDAGPKGNMARFMNHCCQPNCETQKWTVNGDTRVGLFATTDIPANTELTFNYNLECTGTEKKVCKCGAPNCSGFIGVKVKNESAETKKPKKERKKKEPEKPLVLPPCYLCEKRGKVSLCNNKICNKAYHLSCLKLEVSEGKKFICPWHYCNVCSKRTIRCCVKCLNSFCPSHSEGNVRYDKLLGFVCSKHDSMNVEDRCNTVKRKRNHPITDEDVVTSTTNDNDDDVSLLQRMKQSKKNKVEEGNNDSVIRETRNETVSSATETDFEGKFKLKRKKKTLRDKRLEKITANSVSHV